MANIPPSEPPPQQFAAYPRASVYGSAEKLQALADGYFGLNNVFYANIAMVFATRILSAVAKDQSPEAALGIWIGFVVIFVIAIGAATYPFNKKIAFGCNWNSSSAAIASVLMGLNSALCCGIIGYVVMQRYATKEMANYGIKTGGLFGLKKHEVQAAIDQMKAQGSTI